MKLFVFIICSMLSLNCLAQTTDVNKGKALYVIDGVPDSSMNKIKSEDILNISVLDKDKFKGSTKADVTVIVTKKAGIKQYQQKFSELNKKYKDYIDTKHNDSNLAYVVDNVILNMDRKSSLDKLYELKPEDIKSITFKKDSHFTTDATLVIETKQY